MVATLSKLPTELLLEIATNLGHASALALALTNKQIYNAVGYAARSTRYNMHDLLAIERWPCYDAQSWRAGAGAFAIHPDLDCFACCVCRRIRKPRYFGTAWIKGSRGKRYSTPKFMETRVCLECALADEVSIHGPPVCSGASGQTLISELIESGLIEFTERWKAERLLDGQESDAERMMESLRLE